MPFYPKNVIKWATSCTQNSCHKCCSFKTLYTFCVLFNTCDHDKGFWFVSQSQECQQRKFQTSSKAVSQDFFPECPALFPAWWPFFCFDHLMLPRMKMKFFHNASQNFTTLALFLVSSVTADYPFEHFNWKNQINVIYSKPWISYIHAYIGSKSSYLVGIFTKHNSKLNFTKMMPFLQGDRLQFFG